MKLMRLNLVLCILVGFTQPPSASAKNKRENWYFNVGLGWTDIAYPDDLEETFDALEHIPEADNPVLGDIGVYWPRDDRTLVGGALNSWGASYEREGEGADHETWEERKIDLTT